MMICPQCKGEYRDGFNQCADCFVNLVVASPPPAEERAPVRHDVELVTVFETGNPALAAVASTLLDSASIRYVTRGGGLEETFGIARFSASMSQIAGPFEFQVDRADAADAKALLSDVKAAPPLEEIEAAEAADDGPAVANDPGLDVARLEEFGRRYAVAWCSQDPAKVASFFAESAALTINEGAPSRGRAAIAAAAREFMTAFPDMEVTMDGLDVEGSLAFFRWTLNGTITGPDGTGKRVQISGYEEWRIGADGLIADSKGFFDEAEYRRQLEFGFDAD
ncbi:MAG TPA: nuclear transport factor 2 family protein [Candidatus Polarisedimenticolia bacterium]|nr:nuclear transport factor 2 family protein [Candidatus Polarisedimenticolia bacterium]